MLIFVTYFGLIEFLVSGRLLYLTSVLEFFIPFFSVFLVYFSF